MFPEHVNIKDKFPLNESTKVSVKITRTLLNLYNNPFNRGYFMPWPWGQVTTRMTRATRTGLIRSAIASGSLDQEARLPLNNSRNGWQIVYLLDHFLAAIIIVTLSTKTFLDPLAKKYHPRI
jgi:hypothetical protein